MHCGEAIQEGDASREHSPTKSLLNEPYPEELPTVPAHRTCNNGYSLDEEYFGAFLASAICGSTAPDPERFPASAAALKHSPGLRRRIGKTRRVQGTLWGAPEIQWEAEIDRITRVVVKNARGHALFEIGEAMPREPSGVGISPIQLLSDHQRDAFENFPDDLLLPEVGSRMMQRMISGNLHPGGWVEVQPDVYRYAVFQTREELLVRLVLREYLAVEVAWDDSSIG